MATFVGRGVPLLSVPKALGTAYLQRGLIMSLILSSWTEYDVRVLHCVVSYFVIARQCLRHYEYPSTVTTNSAQCVSTIAIIDSHK